MFYSTNGKFILQTCLQEIDMIFLLFSRPCTWQLWYTLQHWHYLSVSTKKIMYSWLHEFSYHMKSFCFVILIVELDIYVAECTTELTLLE